MRAEAAVSSVLSLEGGRLEIAAAEQLAVSPVAPLVGRLRARHPRVSCTVSMANSDEQLIETVAGASAELGFMYVPEAAAAGAGLTWRLLGEHEYRAVLPPTADLPPGPVTLESLVARADAVAAPPGRPMRDYLFDLTESLGVSARQMVTVDAPRAVLPIVLAGGGMTIAPRDEARRRPHSARSSVRSLPRSPGRTG